MTADTSGISGPLPNGTLTGFTNDGFTIIDSNTVEWIPTANTPAGSNYFNNLTTESLEVGERYYITLEVSGYSGTNYMGFSTSGGVPSSMRLDTDGFVSGYFTATSVSKPDFFARPTNSGTITGTIQKVVPGNIFGFTRLEADKLIKAGIVTEINNNTVTIDNNNVKVISDVSLISGSNPGSNPNGHYFYFDNKEEMDNLFGRTWLGGDTINIGQYRNNILISTGEIKIFNDATHGLLGRYNYNPQAPTGGDWQTGDIISAIPSVQNYVFFVKNQVVNKTSLKGYYANVKFENNSKRDAEIFSVGSEITESSK